jgi:hypothetical protein
MSNLTGWLLQIANLLKHDLTIFSGLLALAFEKTYGIDETQLPSHLLIISCVLILITFLWSLNDMLIYTLQCRWNIPNDQNPKKPVNTAKLSKKLITQDVVKPATEVKPTKVVKPTKKVTQTKVVKPTKKVTQTKVVKPAKVVTSTKEVKPAKVVKPNREVKPDKVMKPTKEVKPTKVVNPIKNWKKPEKNYQENSENTKKNRRIPKQSQ